MRSFAKSCSCGRSTSKAPIRRSTLDEAINYRTTYWPTSASRTPRMLRLETPRLLASAQYYTFALCQREGTRRRRLCSHSFEPQPRSGHQIHVCPVRVRYSQRCKQPTFRRNNWAQTFSNGSMPVIASVGYTSARPSAQNLGICQIC